MQNGHLPYAGNRRLHTRYFLLRFRIIDKLFASSL